MSTFQDCLVQALESASKKGRYFDIHFNTDAPLFFESLFFHPSSQNPTPNNIFIRVKYDIIASRPEDCADCPYSLAVRAKTMLLMSEEEVAHHVECVSRAYNFKCSSFDIKRLFFHGSATKKSPRGYLLEIQPSENDATSPAKIVYFVGDVKVKFITRNCGMCYLEHDNILREIMERNSRISAICTKKITFKYGVRKIPEFEKTAEREMKTRDLLEKRKEREIAVDNIFNGPDIFV